MTKKASNGIQELIERTAGTGAKVRATVTVDQPYAQDQHETMFYKHASGGRAKFLEAPLFENLNTWMQGFANNLLKPGRFADMEWGGVGRKLADQVKTEAPIDFGDLRNSAALLVKAGSKTVINEPAKQERLSEAELEAKDYMRSMGVGYR
jgi:hypothetical protein